MASASVAISFRLPSWLRPPRKLVYTAGIGFGIFLLGYFLNSRKKRKSEQRASAGAEAENGDVVRELRRDVLQNSFKSDSCSSRQRLTSERSTRASLRGASTTIPSHECQLMTGCDNFQSIVQILETALAGFDLLKNRSERDKNRAELLSSVLTRMRIIETDINRLVTEGGYDREDLPATDAIATAMWNGFTSRSRRTGSMSLLSDDSFHSCFEDLATCLDDPCVRDALNFDGTSLALYQQGLQEATSGRVEFRKSRAQICGCENELEFAAKLWCLRQAFEEILDNDDNRQWLINTGRQIMCDILRHDKHETKEFVRVFDEIIAFLDKEENRKTMKEELEARKVAQLGMWDVLLDFILLDAFDDMSSPPSAIVAILSNRFITRKMKETSLSTMLWTMIAAKRKRLHFSDGFMSKFYSLTEIIAPPLTLAFFGGSTASYRELCQYFKQQVYTFVNEIFSFNMRYTCLAELTEDVHAALRSTIESLEAKIIEKEFENV
uniref:Mitoguardin n=1 Tax=Steinernema glaseri TaxID=37863 RepID=A0A1I7XZ32_9BILA